MILSSKFLEFTNQKQLETIIANPETAKQKLLQTVALIALANGFFNIKKARLKQATVNLGAGTILWVNQEAFLHKALSENVSSLSAENERLSGLVSEFEKIGMDLRSLSESKREQLKQQMSKFHDLFQSLTETVKEGNRSFEEAHRKLEASVAMSTSNLMQSQETLNLIFRQVIKRCESIETQDDLSEIRRQITTLNKLAELAIRQQPFKESLI